MAPFAKGGRGARGRGGGSSRGRGGNFFRGRGASRGKRPTFHSTRVEEPHAENSDESQASDIEPPEIIEEYLEVESEASDLEELAAIIKPYNALLQSLSRESHSVQPPRKKRKVSLDDVSAQQRAGSKTENAASQSVDQDVDFVEEPEERGNLLPEDIDETESLDDIENGMCTASGSVETTD